MRFNPRQVEEVGHGSAQLLPGDLDLRHSSRHSRMQGECAPRLLRHHIAETLYLVGDIVDGWNWGPSWHWSVEQQELVNEIVRWRRSVNVVFLPGNHDEAQVGLVEGLIGPIATKTSLVHTTAAGARMLVIHGHQFDGSLNPNRLLPMIGSKVYARGQRIHDWYNRRCEAGDDEGRSLSDYIRIRRAERSSFSPTSAIAQSLRRRAITRPTALSAAIFIARTIETSAALPM